MLLIAVKCAVIAWVYVKILARPGNILGWWARLLNNYLVKEKFTPYYERKEHWILKPVLTCELCVAGQIALWSYLFPVLWTILDAVFAICLTITIAKTISVLFKKYSDEQDNK